MDNKADQIKPGIDVEIEELEPKIAPDGGETVLPLVPPVLAQG